MFQGRVLPSLQQLPACLPVFLALLAPTCGLSTPWPMLVPGRAGRGRGHTRQKHCFGSAAFPNSLPDSARHLCPLPRSPPLDGWPCHLVSLWAPLASSEPNPFVPTPPAHPGCTFLTAAHLLPSPGTPFPPSRPGFCLPRPTLAPPKDPVLLTRRRGMSTACFLFSRESRTLSEDEERRTYRV